MFDEISYLEVSRAETIVSTKYEWRKWAREIPYLKVPDNWEIRAIPPFGGALIRYNIKCNNFVISVYLDAYDSLGCMDMKPYWEIHPSADDDCERFYMHEIDKLMDGLQRSFDAHKPEDIL